MEPPPIQYVQTSDGFDIAYCVSGKGTPFVFMPWPFSNLPLMWRSQFGRPLLEALASRFRLVQYDSRGLGMSTRGLPEYHVMDDYLLDLEAVIESAGLDRFVLYAGPFFGRVAIHYAVQHPERVEAMVLGDVSIDAGGPGVSGYQELARRDWEFYLHVRALASGSAIQGVGDLPYWRESVSQEDHLKMLSLQQRSSVRELLPLVRVPTLILSTRRLTQDAPESHLAEQGRSMAALIPNARLILYDVFASYFYSAGPEPPAAVLAIEEFLDGLGQSETQPDLAATTPVGVTDRLSPREIEVLRLVAAGKSNQGIADELVLSIRTVERHINHIYAKVGVHTKAQATAYALRHQFS